MGTDLERILGANRDYCTHFSVISQTAGKFFIDFVRMILGKVGLTSLLDYDGKLASEINFDFELLWIALFATEIIVAIFE